MMVSCFSILTGVLSVSAEVYPVELTAEQTLALYGASFSALYYTGQGVASATFDYVGTTQDVVQAWRDTGSYISGTGDPTQATNPGDWSTDNTLFWGTSLGADGFSPTYATNSRIRNSNFLIYKTEIAQLPASGSFDFQIDFDFPLNIGCQGFASMVLWSSGEGGLRTGNTASRGYLYDDSENTLAIGTGSPPGNSDYYNYYARGKVFTYLGDVVSSSGVVTDHAFLWSAQPDYICMSLAAYPVYSDGVNADSITISKQKILVNKVTTTPYAHTFSHVSGVYEDFSANTVYCLVQCPLVYGDYIPPEPEYNTDENINNINNNTNQIVLTTEQLRQILLRIETNSADILTVERVHTSQFIDIIDKLNDIYNNMQGALSPTLTPAQGLTPHDAERETLKGIIGNTAPTASQLQPFAGAIAIVGGVFGNLVSATGLATTAGICVTLLVFQWVLKRGRGQ